MVGKVVVSLVSLILLVGVIVGVVLVVNKNGESKDDEKAKVQMKRVHEFCQSTGYKDQCARSLEGVAKNESATVQDYLIAAFKATLEEVKKGLNEAGQTNVNKEEDPYNHMAIDDCKKLLRYAIDTLEEALSFFGATDVESLHKYTLDIMNWISQASAFQVTCMDAIDKPEIKSVIEKGLSNATKLTVNAIDIAAKLSEVLKSFNIQIPQGLLNVDTSPHRRLLDLEDGYPTWFPAADRKLLQIPGKGNTGPPLPPVGPGPYTPHAVVAKDGSGKFKTIMDAIKSYPPNHQGRYIIYVKAGEYHEQVIIDKPLKNIFMYGDGAGKTIITCDKNSGIMKITTINTATFAVDAPGFIAKGITFRNTAGHLGLQAIALRTSGDRAVIFDCSIEGNQDTLCYHSGLSFYRNCVISGTIDFIFGMGTTLIQNSQILVRKPKDTSINNTVTADGKYVPAILGGVVLQNCKIVPEDSYFAIRFTNGNFLARPWKEFSTNIFMECEIGDLIRPEGFLVWKGHNHHETAFMYEYANRGPGANTSKRSKDFKKYKALSPEEAAKFTLGAFLGGKEWVPPSSAPFYLGLGGK